MRSTRRSKTVKKPARRNIKKKKRNRSKGIFSWSDDLSGLFLDDINEVLREHKARRAECNGSWKVMPKDSCEVYKDRRLRTEINRRKQQNAASSSYESDSRFDGCRRDRRNVRRRQQRKKLPKRRVIVKNKRNKKSRGSESTFSNSSSSMTTTETSASEMD